MFLPYRHAVIAPYDLALYIAVAGIWEVVVTILQTPLYTRSAILLGNHKRFWCSVLSCDDLLPPSTYTRSAIIFGKPVDNGFAALSADEKGWWASSSAIAGKTSNGFVERPRCADMWGLP